jgi:hypothetical protein
MKLTTGICVLLCAAGVAGCAQKELRLIRSTTRGPDEFQVLPPKPLPPPTDYATLPQPTPGGSNLVDPTPQADAVAALGGRTSALDPNGGIPAGDSALVTAASRHGVEPGVRESLAAADSKFRKRQRRTGRIKLFPVDRYEQAYRKQALEPFAVTEEFRRSGFGTPTSPPEVLE